MPADAGRASPTPAAPEPGRTVLSQFELDLLVVGYLSAVARALNHRGVAACRLRMEPTEQDRLSGSLDLESVINPGSAPARLDWDETLGWSALPHGDPIGAVHSESPEQEGTRRQPPEHPAAPRYLHQMAVPDPSAVAEAVAELAAGRDVGTVCPPSCPEQDYGHTRGRTRVITNLARFALPEVHHVLGSWPRQQQETLP